MALTRRDLLSGGIGSLLGLAGGAALLSSDSLHTAKVESTAPLLSLNYKIYTQGREGERFPQGYQAGGDHSVITEIDLKTGTHKIKPVPIFSAHHVLPLQAAESFLLTSQKGPHCSLLDGNLDHQGILSAPNGMIFGGHGGKLPESDYIFLALGDSRKGYAGIYNIKTFAVEELIDIGGAGPHDVSYLPDGITAVISCAGRDYSTGDSEKAHSSSEPSRAQEEDLINRPKIVLFNMKTMKKVKEYFSPVASPVVHLTTTDIGKVFSTSNLYINGGKNNPQEALQKAYPDHSWPLHPMEMEEGPIRPSALIEYDLESGNTRTIFLGNEVQRRSQSIVYHTQSRTALAVFVFSNTLVAMTPNGEDTVYDVRKMGITSPIGLCDLPGTPYFAIGGVLDDVAIIDIGTMKPVQRIPMHLFRSSHLTSVAT